MKAVISGMAAVAVLVIAGGLYCCIIVGAEEDRRLEALRASSEDNQKASITNDNRQ